MQFDSHRGCLLDLWTPKLLGLCTDVIQHIRPNANVCMLPGQSMHLQMP